MPSLAEYQQAMQAYLLAETQTSGLATAWCRGQAAASTARLATYRATCRGTLVNALRLSYPAVRQLLGAEFFDAAATRFVRTAPPNSAYLNDYGEDFAQFVAELPTTASLPYLWDLARLEWAVNRALHAPDVAGLDVRRLESIEPDVLGRLRFRANPAVSVRALRFPVEQIWLAVLERDEAAMRGIDITAGRRWVLVERDAALAVQIRPVCEAVGRLSERLFAGAPLHDALAAAGDEAGDPTLLQAALADHLGRGRLVDFDVAGSFESEGAI